MMAQVSSFDPSSTKQTLLSAAIRPELHQFREKQVKTRRGFREDILFIVAGDNDRQSRTETSHGASGPFEQKIKGE